MKKTLAILLSCMMLLTGCSKHNLPSENQVTTTIPASVSDTEPETDSTISQNTSLVSVDTKSEEYINTLGFTSLSDKNLMRYLEDTVYSDLIDRIDSDKYFVENVEAVYISKEYLEESAYNSQENIYFGYKLSELDEAFQGEKYIFTLGENGQTDVIPFEEYSYPYDTVIRNVAVGTGVILLCVTVSAVSGGMGVPAVNMIFATSAKSATVIAMSSGVISGVSAGIVEGMRTHDFEKAIQTGVLEGSEGFMWGAITGAIEGGEGQYIVLKGATRNGLKLKEVATIQKESKYPLDVIRQFKSMKEYNIYKDADLSAHMVNGKTALLQDIDVDFKSTFPDGSKGTNLQRMLKGYSPIEPLTGKEYQLHHIGQKADGTLAVLTQAQHQGNAGILNTVGKESEIDRIAFTLERKAFWKDAGRLFQQELT